MYVKGNPILSKMYAHSGLTLNEKGLFFHLQNAPSFYFLITEDHTKIIQIMGFDPEEYENAKEYEEFFKLLGTNQFFRPSRFVEDTSEGGSKMLKELSEYLAINPIYKGYTTRQIRDMFEPLKEFNFEQRYNRLIELKENQVEINKKIKGSDVLTLKPDFDKTKLQLYFEYFNKEKFETIVDRLEYLHTHTTEEIVEEFVKYK